MLMPVKILEGRKNSAKYLATMKSFCVPIMNLNVESKIYLVQDNNSMYVSRQSVDFFKEQDFELIEFL